MDTETEKLTVTLDLSHPDWFGEDGLSDVSSCLRLLAYGDHGGKNHRARVARALADQIDAQIPASTDEKSPTPFDDPYYDAHYVLGPPRRSSSDAEAT